MHTVRLLLHAKAAKDMGPAEERTVLPDPCGPVCVLGASRGAAAWRAATPVGVWGRALVPV